MYTNEKKSMKAISNYAGARVDYVQGGGGNTSYKFDDKLMAIKASGYSLAEVDEEKGYVIVEYDQLKSDYEILANKQNVDIEKETLSANLKNIVLLKGMEKKRPSVEVGFHSYLQRAVVHTHSVYANILCCSEEGELLLDQIFGKSDLGYIFIPFINPGFKLSMYIKSAVEAYENKHNKKPDLIFMESHGMIASNDDYLQAMAIHEKANKMMIDQMSVQAFPVAKVKALENGYECDTDAIKHFIKTQFVDEKYFDEIILYPDQMVYLGENLGKTIMIDQTSGSILYKMSEKQAKIAEEVILGVIYIISEIKRKKLTLKLLCAEGVDFIRNWESEKYRANLLK